MHLVIYFDGTGGPGYGEAAIDYITSNANIRTAYVKGCDSPEVCNSFLFPNLKKFAHRFVNNLFSSTKGTLRLRTTTKDALESVGLNLNLPDKFPKLPSLVNASCEETIESITLCGHSRGAVTCFEVAKQLNQIAPMIPVDIVADHPVPGNYYSFPGTNARNIADCSSLKNLRNVSIILGAYTGALLTGDRLSIGPSRVYDSKGNVKFELFHRGFFSQIVPKLPRTTHRDFIVVPDETHDRIGGSAGPCHMHMQIAKYLHKQHLISKEALEKKVDEARFCYYIRHPSECTIRNWPYECPPLPSCTTTPGREELVFFKDKIFFINSVECREIAVTAENKERLNRLREVLDRSLTREEYTLIRKIVGLPPLNYAEHAHQLPATFPPIPDLQHFFGIKHRELYRYMDKLHPAPELRTGMLWQKNETLIDWWKKHDKKASRFLTHLTQELVGAIEKTVMTSDSLLTLFTKADQWLIAKEHTVTSRYYQVESLRNNIYHRLIHEYKIPKQRLAHINRRNLHEGQYFLKHWEVESSAASWFKTEETQKLDSAFKIHASSPPSQGSDNQLKEALDIWLENKKHSRTNRYDLVISIREHLQDVIESCYEAGMPTPPNPNKQASAGNQGATTSSIENGAGVGPLC
jgi:hypothetical protein